MNALFRLRKGMPLAEAIPFKYLVYAALLSDTTTYYDKDDDTKYVIFARDYSDIYDYFSDWEHSDERRCEVLKALNDLSDDNLIFFDEEDRIYVGEMRGRKFFPFEIKSSLFDDAKELLEKELNRYGKSKSAKDKSRAKFIRGQIEKFYAKGVENMTPGDFTELHGFLYEIYTGGEIYLLRGKVEHFQTTNMLKAYDKLTTFSLITEATLRYDTYRKKGVPTLTNVACMKDDVFHALTRPEAGSKDYMRDISSSDNSEF